MSDQPQKSGIDEVITTLKGTRVTFRRAIDQGIMSPTALTELEARLEDARALRDRRRSTATTPTQ